MLHAMAKIKANVTLNNRLYNALLEACHKHQLAVVQAVKHEFFPHGMTAVAVLSESHAAIHTFPEWEQVFVDVFTCRVGFIPIVVIETFAHAIGGSILQARITDRLEGEERRPFLQTPPPPWDRWPDGEPPTGRYKQPDPG